MLNSKKKNIFLNIWEVLEETVYTIFITIKNKKQLLECKTEFVFTS